MLDAILLTRSTIGAASPAFQQELVKIISGILGSAAPTTPDDDGPGGPGPQPATQSDGDDWLPDLSLAQARKVTQNISEKGMKAYKFIAEAPVSGFSMIDVQKALGVSTNLALRSVWSGITRRLRSVLDDPEAQLIHWTWSDEIDNWTGRVSAHTHRSLRKVLGLD